MSPNDLKLRIIEGSENYPYMNSTFSLCAMMHQANVLMEFSEVMSNYVLAALFITTSLLKPDCFNHSTLRTIEKISQSIITQSRSRDK